MTPFVEQIAALPRAPGVYLMKDARGVVLYVGKASDLRSRVASYFRATAQERPHIPLLLQRVTAIETTVTDTEKEALLLEHTLIRKHRPRYNIIFRDDKSYMSVRVNLQHAFPGIFRTRKVLKDGADYFGPFPSGLACKETIELVTRYFQLRTCRDHEFANRARPCLQHQIGRCTAPCVGLVEKSAYREQVARALLLLKGRRNELSAHLEHEMRALAAAEQFEAAARLRDLLRDVQTTIESQKVVRHGAADADFFGWAEAEGHGAVAVLERRGGRVGERGGAAVVLGGELPAALLASYLLQYYQPPRVPPPVIHLPFPAVSAAELTDLLTERRGSAVRLHVPRRGEAIQLVRLAGTNARACCERRQAESVAGDRLMALVGEALHLSEVPSVIECVDVSNWQGEEAVASLVCFKDGAPAKQRYRHYKVRGPQEPNDYAMMLEILTRRLQRTTSIVSPSPNPLPKGRGGRMPRGGPRGASIPPRPDLLLVDGGRGQLGIAERVLKELAMHDLPLAAIAKPREGEPCDKIYLPGRKNPLPLRAGDPVLLLLQRLRDEAHRFAITFHRKRLARERGIV